jgi:hypothetical protein
MRPQPIVLFNGTPLMQFAHTMTAKAQKTVENEKYEYLTAQPVDALIQRLYMENEIVLPRLNRDPQHIGKQNKLLSDIRAHPAGAGQKLDGDAPLLEGRLGSRTKPCR